MVRFGVCATIFAAYHLLQEKKESEQIQWESNNFAAWTPHKS